LGAFIIYEDYYGASAYGVTGGDAISISTVPTTRKVYINNYGIIAGGGGGGGAGHPGAYGYPGSSAEIGGGGGGGGGQGLPGGTGGTATGYLTPANAGTYYGNAGDAGSISGAGAGGAGGYLGGPGGNGGAWGAPGSSGGQGISSWSFQYAGGNAGYAIFGIANYPGRVIYTNYGTTLGTTV
jgi:hypothetical protein